MLFHRRISPQNKSPNLLKQKIVESKTTYMLKHIIQSSKITAFSITQNISQTILCLNLKIQNQLLTTQSIHFIFKYLQQDFFFIKGSYD